MIFFPNIVSLPISAPTKLSRLIYQTSHIKNGIRSLSFLVCNLNHNLCSYTLLMISLAPYAFSIYSGIPL